MHLNFFRHIQTQRLALLPLNGGQHENLQKSSLS